jgi:hypothetical protein
MQVERKKAHSVRLFSFPGLGSGSGVAETSVEALPRYLPYVVKNIVHGNICITPGGNPPATVDNDST